MVCSPFLRAFLKEITKNYFDFPHLFSLEKSFESLIILNHFSLSSILNSRPHLF